MTGPCSFCGVPVTQSSAPPRGPAAARIDVDSRVCGGCLTLDPSRPGALLRAAARVAGGSEDNPYLLDALRDDDAALDGVLFADPAAPLRGAGRRAFSPTPWAHVPAATLAALADARRRAYEAWLAADRGQVDGGRAGGPCLVCGSAESAWWRAVVTSALAPGPELVTGDLCAACGACHDRVGSVGPTLVEAAWRATAGADWPKHLPTPRLRPWAAAGRPDGAPWSWVDAAPPAREPTAAELAAELAALRAELRSR